MQEYKTIFSNSNKENSKFQKNKIVTLKLIMSLFKLSNNFKVFKARHNNPKFSLYNLETIFRVSSKIKTLK